MSGFAGVTEELEKHPLWIALAVLGVAMLAFIQRGNNDAGSANYSFAGGGRAAPVDPEAAAIEEAAIAAGSQNLGIIASLLGTKDTNATALAGSLAQTGAARDVSLSSISAQRDIGLHQIDAAEEVANYQATVGLEGLQNTNAASITAAQITAGTQRAISDSQTALGMAEIQSNENVAQFQTQASKDIARAGDNTSIVGGLIHLAGEALAFFGF